ncbi:MAG: prepilin peptidase [Oligoflexia bacterium]|nr:prepilin peptidase [Oligoflexia bacterium]
MISFFVFVFGALFGSFANVIIYRVPRNKSIVFPRSACPHCDTLIKWYQNIPIISYLFLRGKCANQNCRAQISIKYPIVELLSALMALYLFPSIYQIDFYSLIIFAFNFNVFIIFICHFFIDLEHQILPDGLNLYLLVIFLIYALFEIHLYDWIIGGLIGFLFPFMIAQIFFKLKGQHGLGGGDIKLYGILGIYLGPVGIMQNLFISCFLGSIVGLILIITKRISRNVPIPFGPFIIFAASIQIFFNVFYKKIITLVNSSIW